MSFRAHLAAVTGVSIVLSTLVAVLPANADTITASELPGLLTVGAETTAPAYDRDLFEHWIDADGDGCNTRYEVLIEESITPVAVGAGCTLTGGTWVSSYDTMTTTDPAQIEMDHVVALAEAWRSGASGWTNDQRRLFANDLDVPYALTAASSASNQAKADKDPAEWLPTNTEHTCQYVTSWALIKYRWSLKVDPVELAALQAELSGSCGATPVTLPTVVVQPGAQPTPVTSISAFPAGVSRLAGASRYDTAIAASQKYAANVPVVFVATGTNFPDALSASAAAALLGGPLLLTPAASVPANVLNELIRLQPAQIYAIGSTGAISTTAFNQLNAVAPTTRLGGADRYSTGLNIVNTAFTSSSTAFIATGRNYPDALAATGAAGKLHAPIILVDGQAGTVPAAVLQTLTRLGVSSVAIAGGSSVVSTGIQQQLTNAGYGVTRHAGADRYSTAATINNAYFGPGTSSTMFLATAANFPDALAGAAIAGRLGVPLYITTTACTPTPVHDSIAALAPTTKVVMGSTAVVSDQAAANIGCLSGSRPTITGSTAVTSTLYANPGTWTSGAAFTYKWFANGVQISGTGSSLSVTAGLYGKRISVQVTGTKTGYTTLSLRSVETSAVWYPSRTAPIDTWTCPSWAPIKGNADSMIYHMPGGRYYDATNPEECFRTESAAVAAGYRKSKL